MCLRKGTTQSKKILPQDEEYRFHCPPKKPYLILETHVPIFHISHLLTPTLHFNFAQLHSTISLSRFPGKNHPYLLCFQQPRWSWPGAGGDTFRRMASLDHRDSSTSTRNPGGKNVIYSFTKSYLSLELQLWGHPRPCLELPSVGHAMSLLNSCGFQREWTKMQPCDDRPPLLPPAEGVTWPRLHPGPRGSCLLLGQISSRQHLRGAPVYLSSWHVGHIMSHPEKKTIFKHHCLSAKKLWTQFRSWIY